MSIRTHILRLSIVTFLINVSGLKLAIIGAGPSGLLFASKVLSSSLEVTEIDIYDSRGDPREAHNEFYHRSFAIGCNPRIWAVIDAYDPQLTAHLKHGYCSFMNETWAIDDKKRKSQPGRLRYMTHQPMFASGLLSWLKQQQQTKSSSSTCKLNIKFHTNCISIDPITGLVISQTNSAVRKSISSSQPDDSSSINAGAIQSKVYDLIVGADGVKSVVRNVIMQQNGVTAELFDNPARWKFLNVTVPMVPAYVNSSRFFSGLSKGGPIGASWYMPSGRTHMIFAWVPRSKQEVDNPLGLSTPPQAQNTLARIFELPEDQFQEAAATLIADKGRTERIVKLNKYHHDSGKVVLIGDAAHSMSHALGQGMGVALDDVDSLHRHLTQAQWRDLPQALQAYSTERVPEGNAITDLNFVSYVRSHWLSQTIFMLAQIIGKIFLRRGLLFDDLRDPSMKWTKILQRYRYWADKGRVIADRKRAMLMGQ